MSANIIATNRYDNSSGSFLCLLLHSSKGVAEVESDVQCAVLVDCDPVDQLGENGTGKTLDIAVLFEVLDEVVGRDVIIVRLTEGRFELLDALGQIPLRLLVLLVHDPILVGIDDAVL